jgi:hypothetical protein
LRYHYTLNDKIGYILKVPFFTMNKTDGLVAVRNGHETKAPLTINPYPANVE